jgi:hypothetical protein
MPIPRQLANACKNVRRQPHVVVNNSSEAGRFRERRMRGARLERSSKGDRQKKSGLVAPQPAKRGVFGQLLRRLGDVDAKSACIDARRLKMQRACQ